LTEIRRFPLRLLQGCAQRAKRELKFGKAETEHSRLSAEPCAITDPEIEGGECRMKVDDGGLVELIQPQAQATERARIHPTSAALRATHAACARKTFAEMFSAAADDRVGLAEDAQPSISQMAELAIGVLNFPSTNRSRKALGRTIAQPMRRRSAAVSGCKSAPRRRSGPTLSARSDRGARPVSKMMSL
jgi:hypothetical protein